MYDYTTKADRLGGFKTRRQYKMLRQVTVLGTVAFVAFVAGFIAQALFMLSYLNTL